MILLRCSSGEDYSIMFSRLLHVLFALCAVCSVLFKVATPRRKSRRKRQEERVRRCNLIRVLCVGLLFGPQSVNVGIGVLAGFLGLAIGTAILTAVYQALWWFLIQIYGSHIFWYNILFAINMERDIPENSKETRKAILQLRRANDRLLRKIGKRIRRWRWGCEGSAQGAVESCSTKRSNAREAQIAHSCSGRRSHTGERRP